MAFLIENSSELIMPDYPKSKLTIIGGGIIGFLEAYYAYLAASQRGDRIRVTIYEKNETIQETTTAHLVPSLTPDEILAVVPKGQELMNKLRESITEPGGLRVDDVIGINDSRSACDFIHAVEVYSQDEEGQRVRTETLLALGKMSMDLWQNLYDHADAELKAILEASNFHPCRERTNRQVHTLQDGYRIDLIYGVSNALSKAHKMIADYESLGYRDCRTLSPDEIVLLDPFLTEFCQSQSEKTIDGIRVWKDDTVGLWRPGGCINTPTFLPLFHDYLKKIMGKYTNDAGIEKDCFQFRLQRCVEQVTYKPSGIDSSSRIIDGLKFFGHTRVKHNKHPYPESHYVFCPGESVGTLKSLGFAEPEYARFAGASLILRIAIPADQIASYVTYNQWMEIHKDGFGVAWQARFVDHHIVIGIGGTKAFYGEKRPHKDQAFAIHKNLLQLNIINEILPEFVSWALKKPTRGVLLTLSDMMSLEERGIATRWVGARAVAYDGFPTVGPVFNDHGIINNARCTTQLGSGGVSFAPAVIGVSRGSMFVDASQQDIAHQVLTFGDSQRTYRKY
jgi:hypothetical protein